jgi:hypothetical protein
MSTVREARYYVKGSYIAWRCQIVNPRNWKGKQIIVFGLLGPKNA